MTTIPQRLRDIAKHIHECGLTKDSRRLKDIAAELEAPAADAAPVVAEYPAGAVENGRAYAARLESAYQFECEAGPLANCSDWHDLIRCFEHLAAWPMNHLATVSALQARIKDLETQLKTRSQKLREAGYTRRPSAKTLPPDK